MNNLEADGSISIYDIYTSLVVAEYEGLSVHETHEDFNNLLDLVNNLLNVEVTTLKELDKLMRDISNILTKYKAENVGF